MGLAQPVHRYSATEYLALERAAAFKSEFYDGEIFAMAGGSPMHSLIGTNAAAEFRNKLRGGGCRSFNSDLRVRPPGLPFYTYPDISVVCGPLEFDDEQEDTVTNPSLIAEVTSPSTEGYDRGAKFRLYSRIPSLKEYVVISHAEPSIDVFIRQSSGEWLIRSASGMESSIELPGFGIRLELAEVYAGVQFEPAKGRQRPPAV